MKFSNLLNDFTNQGERERTKGYFWTSEIYNIRKGRVTPDNFFENEPIDIEGCRRIQTGNASESWFSHILDTLEIPYQYEPKKYCVIDKDSLEERWVEEWPEELDNEICLTVKPDFVFENSVIETKHSSRVYDEIKRWYTDQLEAEGRMFPDKDVYIGFFSYPFDLKLLPYKRSKRRWGNVKKLLVEFDNKFNN